MWPKQHSLASNWLGVSGINKFHQTRGTRLSVLLVFVVLFLLHALLKEKCTLLYTLEIIFVDDQQASSNLDVRKCVSNCSDLFSDRFDDR